MFRAILATRRTILIYLRCFVLVQRRKFIFCRDNPVVYIDRTGLFPELPRIDSGWNADPYKYFSLATCTDIQSYANRLYLTTITNSRMSVSANSIMPVSMLSASVPIPDPSQLIRKYIIPGLVIVILYDGAKKVGEAIVDTTTQAIIWISGLINANEETENPENADEKPKSLADKEGKIANKIGRTVKEVKEAIEKVKQSIPWRSDGKNTNPNVEVDTDTGEVYPKTPDGGIGDSIGNIFDHLP